MTPIHFMSEWALRSSVLILAGSLLVWLPRVKSPSIRQMAWTVLLAGSLAVPVLTAILPKVRFDIGRATATVLDSMPSGDESRLPSAGAAADRTSASARPAPIAALPVDWMRFAAILYALAAGALLLRLFAGLGLSVRIFRRSRPTGIFADGSQVRESGEIASPVTIGLLRPAILLPMEWRGWNPATLDAVLAHERSHIRRRDPAVQFFSAAHRAILWASPLSWLLHRRIVRTGEEISDDDAIAATRDRVSYAEILLEFMRRSAGLRGSAGIPMARYERPETRIRRILNSTGVFRRPARWMAAAILAMGAPLAYFASVAYPQAAPRPAAEEKRPSFEVASIKPAPPPAIRSSPSREIVVRVGLERLGGGGLRVTNMSLREMISYAYQIDCHDNGCRDFISGGPDWMDSSRYDIQARGGPSGQNLDRLTDAQRQKSGEQLVRQRLQSLLADRFQLVLRTEMREGGTYALRIAKSGHKLKPGTEPDLMMGGDNRLTAQNVTMEELAVELTNMLGTPVADKTGLTGKYNFKLEWAPIRGGGGGDDAPEIASADISAPSIFAVLQSRLGLRLEKSKGPVARLVVVRAERPSEN